MLNAFRHHGRKHILVTDLFGANISCSTPFGIMEENTIFSALPLLAEVCAQRLSASWKKTRRCVDTVPENIRCSTPFGIMEENTGRKDDLQTEKDVLNAFRHHGRKHIKEPFADAVGFMCSTPFGIMEENTSTLIAIVTGFILCSTPFGIMEENTLSHADAKDVLGACSTPFGIMEENTACASAIAAAASCAQRLSASWKKTPGRARAACAASRTCSTPFGIMEENTEPFYVDPKGGP